MSNVNIDFIGKDEVTGVIDGIESSLGGLASVASGVVTAGLAAAAAGVTALGVGLAFSINEALDAQKTQASLAQVLKSTAGQAGLTQEAANALAQQFKDLAGGSDDAIIALETIGLRAGTIAANEMEDFIKASLDLGAVMGDNAAAAELLARAEEDPLAAMARLTKAGIVYDKSLQNQIKALVKAGKTSEATALLMGRLSEATGGAAAANADTLAGKWEIMQGRLADAAEGIGTALLPMLTELFDGFIAPAIPLIEEFATVLGAAFSALASGDLGEAIDALGKSTILQTLGLTGEKMREFVDAITDGSTKIMAAIGPMVTALGSIFEALKNNDPAAFFEALSALGVAAYEWAVGLWNDHIFPGMVVMQAQLVAWIYTQVPIIIDTLTAWGQAFVDWIAPMQEQGEAALEEYLMTVKAWILTKPTELYLALIEWAKSFIEWIAPMTETTLAELGTYLGTVTAWIVGVAIPDLLIAVSEMARAFSAWVRDASDSIVPALGDLWGVIIAWVANDVIPGINQAGVNFVGAFLEGMGKEFPNIVTKLTEVMNNIKQTIRNEFGILQTLGTEIAKNIEIGLVLYTSHIIETVVGMVKSAVNAAGAALGLANSAGLSGGTIPGFASGTNHAPGGLAWVGEDGPELVNLPRGSQVIPNDRVANMGNTFNFTVSNDLDVEIVAQRVAQIIGAA